MKEVDNEYAKKRTCKVMQNVGKIIKAKRNELGFTQLDIAFYINADKCLISSLERGYLANTTLITLIKLAEVFEMNIEDLVNENSTL